VRSALLRAVLDTNVLVSALLFNQGRLSWLRPCWQQVQLTPVLAYPKFRLQAAERERLLEDLLPWCESWTAAIPTSAHRVRDPHEQVFLDLVLAAATPALVTPTYWPPKRQCRPSRFWPQRTSTLRWSPTTEAYLKCKGCRRRSTQAWLC
jgi:hypothetical protein